MFIVQCFLSGEPEVLHHRLLEQHQPWLHPGWLRPRLEVDVDHQVDRLLQQGAGHPHRDPHQDVLHEEHAPAGPQHGVLDVCHGQFSKHVIKSSCSPLNHRRQRPTLVPPRSSTRCLRTCTARTTAPSTGPSTGCLLTSKSSKRTKVFSKNLTKEKESSTLYVKVRARQRCHDGADQLQV